MIRRKFKLYEEDANASNDSTQNTNNSNNSSLPQTPTKANTELENLYNQVNEIQNQLNRYEAQYAAQLSSIERQHAAKVADYKNRISMLNKQIIKKGGAINNQQITEGTLVYLRSKKLFESAQLSKADELCAAISAANDKLETLSYHIDPKSAMSFARKLLVFINDKYWNDGENHWEELKDYFRNVIVKSTVSFSRRELNEFLDTFEKVLRNNTAYSWIFGK